MNKVALERQLWQSQLSKWWLIIGIVLFILGLAGFFFLDVEGQSQPMDEFMRILPLPFVLAYVVIVGPVFEELAFRSWTIGKVWAKVMGLILMVLYSMTLYEYLYITIPLLIIIALGLFYKNIAAPVRLIMLMVSANLLFGFIHISNVNGWAIKLNYTFCAMGIGMILSYISLKYKFIYAVLLHILWNGIAMFLNKDELMKDASFSITYQSEIIEISANRVWLGFKEDSNYDAYINADNLMDSVILENNTLSELVKYWFEKDNNDSNIYFRYTMSISYPYYTGKIWFKKNEEPKAVLVALQDAFKYELKEQKLPTYTLDISQLKSFDPNEAVMNLNDLVDIVNTRYSKTFIVNKEQYLNVKISYEPFDMARKLSNDSDVVALFESIGIQMQSIGDKQIVTLD